MEAHLGNVESVQDQHVLVVLGQRDDVALRGYLKAAAPADLDVRTFELPDERAVPLENGHVEAVPVTVADEHVSCVADVDPVGVVGDYVAADPVQELTVLVEHHDTVTLVVAICC